MLEQAFNKLSLAVDRRRVCLTTVLKVFVVQMAIGGTEGKTPLLLMYWWNLGLEPNIATGLRFNSRFLALKIWESCSKALEGNK